MDGENGLEQSQSAVEPVSVAAPNSRRETVSQRQRRRRGATFQRVSGEGRSLARNIGRLAPKAANFGASLCSMNFQYPKFGRGSRPETGCVSAETGSIGGTRNGARLRRSTIAPASIKKPGRVVAALKRICLRKLPSKIHGGGDASVSRGKEPVSGEDTRPFAPKASNPEACLCRLSFQYPKFECGVVRRRHGQPPAVFAGCVRIRSVHWER